MLWLVRALAEGVVGVDESESSSSSASFPASFSPAPWSDDRLLDFLMVDLALETFARSAR